MKQVKFLAIAVVLVIAGSFSASAQKIGTVNAEGLIGLLPEAKAVQEKLSKFQADTLNVEFKKLIDEYQEKDSLAKDPKQSPSVKKMLEEKVAELSQTINNWQNIAGSAMQQRQEVLLGPLYKKVGDAVNAVAKEKGYTYVLQPEAFYVIPPTDDLTKAVADKLGVKIPADSAAAGGAAPAAGR